MISGQWVSVSFQGQGGLKYEMNNDGEQVER